MTTVRRLTDGGYVRYDDGSAIHIVGRDDRSPAHDGRSKSVGGSYDPSCASCYYGHGHSAAYHERSTGHRDPRTCEVCGRTATREYGGGAGATVRLCEECGERAERLPLEDPDVEAPGPYVRIGADADGGDPILCPRCEGDPFALHNGYGDQCSEPPQPDDDIGTDDDSIRADGSYRYMVDR